MTEELFRVQHFAAFCASRERDERYIYGSYYRCAVTQYMEANKMVIQGLGAGGLWLVTGPAEHIRVPDIIDTIALGLPPDGAPPDWPREHTFGAAYLRCHLLAGNISG